MLVVHAVLHVLGVFLGLLLLPVTIFFVVRHRFQRAFHPDGTVYAARFAALAPAGEPLVGPALVRLSATFTRGEVEKPDVVGLVVRFGASEAAPCPPGAQDLLSATFDGFRPAQLERGKQSTNVHDFLDNDYRAIALYRVSGLGPVRLRWSGLRRTAEAGGDGSRGARLAEAIADDDARFVLEASQGVDAWLALGTLHLERRVDVSQKSLAFSPFRAGRGIHATGLLNGLRRPSYVMSRILRGAWMR